ncbi:thiamine phosphate synthase [Leucobacter sp. CSA1]|uniref:Thiamine-phosphate synthase n=1 Tax=Leucobacter chromiisoli TaxID=2796471 RepID=A0A934Q7N9_9MICO|nr:thiamine phosphate synthase [Leucobacter chromiisoli]
MPSRSRAGAPAGSPVPAGTAALLDPSVYLVTDRALCGARGVAETVRLAVEGGVAMVQLREKHASLDEQLRQVEELAVAIEGRARFVVNDRLDVAVAARDRGLPVDGVHLGQGDEQVGTARAELGDDAILGLTANAPEHLDAVLRLPSGTVDYLGVGVIRPTATKPDHPPALGVDGFARFAAASPLPCVAIGGVRIEDLPELRQGGAAGVALVSALCAAPDPAAAARRFAAAWSRAMPSRATPSRATRSRDARNGAEEGALPSPGFGGAEGAPR